jgi:hypothetical protein
MDTTSDAIQQLDELLRLNSVPYSNFFAGRHYHLETVNIRMNLKPYGLGLCVGGSEPGGRQR